MHVAMWSGPRNLSTALMYSFAARGDCAVIDEPFYAAYLAASGAVHPMRADILASHETDPERVARSLIAAPDDGKAHVYQKHMVHHMTDAIPRDWMRRGVVHAFLIRHPARVVASYAARRENPSPEDLGFDMQLRLFEEVSAFQPVVPVLDSADLRRDPAGYLRALCTALGLPFTPRMLGWKAGGLPQDGVWAEHWYASVHRSTGFDGPEGPPPRLEGSMQNLAEAGMPAYEALRARALTPRADEGCAPR